jgi:glutathione synthase/RimK-type ligase-like ATP-grasp enzyme
LNRLCREEMVHQLAGLLDQALWVSPPLNIKRADNKQLQLEIATRLGMCIPNTLVTSSAEEVTRFRKANGTIIVKPAAKQVILDDEQRLHAIFTNRISPDKVIDLGLLASSPAIFQNEIDREFDIRTVVVGGKVFSISIRQLGDKAGDVDYRDQRGKDLEYKRYDLPSELAEKCVQFVREFGLRYSSMDFILGKDGTHYFLENNPCGAWVFVQNGGNHPIAECLARLLD